MSPYQRYRWDIDQLINIAAELADSIHGEEPPTSDIGGWGARWDRTYHREMDRLCEARGLRRMASRWPEEH